MFDLRNLRGLKVIKKPLGPKALKKMLDKVKPEESLSALTVVDFCEAMVDCKNLEQFCKFLAEKVAKVPTDVNVTDYYIVSGLNDALLIAVEFRLCDALYDAWNEEEFGATLTLSARKRKNRHRHGKKKRA